jgi:hypothetical protein
MSVHPPHQTFYKGDQRPSALSVGSLIAAGTRQLADHA